MKSTTITEDELKIIVLALQEVGKIEPNYSIISVAESILNTKLTYVKY